MTARQPRRSRRRTAPAAPLPRPLSQPQSIADDGLIETLPEEPRARSLRPAPRRAMAPREHHLSQDLGYVRRELVVVSGVALGVLGFIIAMSFVV